MINPIINARQIHEDNFNKYKKDKDQVLRKEAYESFDKSPKTVFSIIQDINDEKMAKGVFNEYCLHLKVKQDTHNRLLKIRKDLEDANKILLFSNVIAIITIIFNLIFER